MDLLPIFERLGLPLALAVYFLMETRRVSKTVEKLHADQLRFAREDAETYRHLALKVVSVVERTNTIIKAVQPILEESAQREDTRIIAALEPTPTVTPPAPTRPLTEDETAKLHIAKAKIRERGPRG
jgi:hypothetical protein